MNITYYFIQNGKLLKITDDDNVKNLDDTNLILDTIHVYINKSVYRIEVKKNIELIKLHNLRKEFKCYNNIKDINDILDKPVIDAYDNHNKILSALFTPQELISIVTNGNSNYKENLPMFILTDDRNIISMRDEELEQHYKDKTQIILEDFIHQELSKKYEIYHDLIFNRNNTKIVIGTYTNTTDAYNAMELHRNENSTIESHYQRRWVKDNNLIIDYGAHNAFYIITNVDDIDI